MSEPGSIPVCSSPPPTADGSVGQGTYPARGEIADASRSLDSTGRGGSSGPLASGPSAEGGGGVSGDGGRDRFHTTGRPAPRDSFRSDAHESGNHTDGPRLRRPAGAPSPWLRAAGRRSPPD